MTFIKERVYLSIAISNSFPYQSKVLFFSQKSQTNKPRKLKNLKNLHVLENKMKKIMIKPNNKNSKIFNLKKAKLKQMRFKTKWKLKLKKG